jgi:lipoate-protein ligase A
MKPLNADAEEIRRETGGTVVILDRRCLKFSVCICISVVYCCVTDWHFSCLVNWTNSGSTAFDCFSENQLYVCICQQTLETVICWSWSL